MKRDNVIYSDNDGRSKAQTKKTELSSLPIVGHGEQGGGYGTCTTASQTQRRPIRIQCIINIIIIITKTYKALLTLSGAVQSNVDNYTQKN